jgi:hypothetical protein
VDDRHHHIREMPSANLLKRMEAVMTTANDIDRELTDAELAHVVGADMALQHEPVHSSSSDLPVGHMTIKFSPEYTRSR